MSDFQRRLVVKRLLKGIAQRISGETHGLFLAGFELSAGELLHHTILVLWQKCWEEWELQSGYLPGWIFEADFQAKHGGVGTGPAPWVNEEALRAKIQALL